MLIVIILIGHSRVKAQQVILKTGYFGKSGYRVMEGETSKEVGNSQGGAMVYQYGVHIPLSYKLDKNNQASSWAINVGGAYAKLNNENFIKPLVIDEIMDMGVSVEHLRPLNENWSLKASVGIGLYMPSSDFSKIGLKNVLGNIGVIFIRHLKPNLDIGGGLAINNAFGYPMLFPAFYLNWRLNGKYDIKISLTKGLDASIGYKVNEKLRLSFIAKMNGQMALLEQNGESKIFSHMYFVTGIHPEIKINKNISVPITVGLNVWRPAEMKDRKFTSIFKEGKEYYFRASFYTSIGFKIGLK